MHDEPRKEKEEMHPVIAKHSRKTLDYGIRTAGPEAMNCSQIREALDATFDGRIRLEETHTPAKRIMFEHLLTGKACCHSFDEGVRFSSPERDRIF